MEGQLGSAGEVGIGTAVGRIDWRRGKWMMARGGFCWQQHEALRREKGLSIAQYCEVNGSALSTFRHRVGRLVRTETGVGPASRARSKSADARGQFIALLHRVAPSSRSTEVEGHLAETTSIVSHCSAVSMTSSRRVCVIYLVLAAQYESLIDPLIILITVPLSICGGLLPLGDVNLGHGRGWG